MRSRLLLAVALGVSALLVGQASNHREAPITALDHKADITDVYAFRSFDDPSNLTVILNVDPLLEPANGPNWFPFDPNILYEIKVDNTHDALADLVFQFRFQTETRLAGLYQAYAGVPGGRLAPANAPPPFGPGTPIVPPQITSFADVGLSQRQRYTATMIRNGVPTVLNNRAGGPLYVVPANVGPRTMDYEALFNAGIYDVDNGIRVFAGTVDDAFWIDLGAAFDTFNFRQTVPGVLNATQDAARSNFAPDTLAGFAVNAIAIEVPITMVTSTGQVEPASSPEATIGVWATTSRNQTTVRRPTLDLQVVGPFRQVQRMGNPLINELIIGTGYKDRFSMDQPANDSQFSNFFLDPPIARILNAITDGVLAIPAPPRNDLLPLVQYVPPVAAPGTPAGPIADLLRLNTGVPPTPPGSASRLGLLGGDPAGFPNGRRLADDVTDIALRVVAGTLAPFPGFDPNIGGRLGDGVNVNDAPFRDTFPYLASAPSGRDRLHDPLPTTMPPRIQADITLSSSLNPSMFGQEVTFTAMVTNPVGALIPTGVVQFLADGQELGTANLDSAGRATFTTAGLNPGTHPITAVYQGNFFFSSNFDDLSQVVNSADTTITVSSTPNPSSFGQLATFTAQVSSPGGTPAGSVVFRDGATILGSASLGPDGRASLATAALSVGTHDVTAEYSGSPGFSGSSSPALMHTVNRAEISLNLSSAPNPSTVGQPVIFTAVASSTGAAPGGVMTVSVDGSPTGTALLVNGVATFSISFLPVGSHGVSVTYSGNANFSGATSNVVAQVVEATSG